MPNLIPPEWMVVAARENPVVYAYMTIGRRVGFDAEFYEALARELATQNDELMKTLKRKAVLETPAVIMLDPPPGASKKDGA